MHDHLVLETNHSDGDFEEPPFHSNSEIIHQMWDNLSNLTLDMNRHMVEVNFDVNLILHKLYD